MSIFRILTFMTIVMLPLILTGCLETTSFPASKIFGWSKPIANSLDEMPPEAARITRCIINVLSGEQCGENVVIDSTLKQKLQQMNIVDPGFVFHSAALMIQDQDDKNMELYTVQGQLVYEDALSRRITINYNSKYDTGNNLKIDTATVSLAGNVRPETVCFIVNNNNFQVDMNSPPSFIRLYQEAGEHAVTPEMAKNTPEQEYIILVFFMDKTTSTAKMRLKLSESPNKLDGYEKSSHYIDYNKGWRVGFVRGKMNLMDPATKHDLYLKAIHVMGNEAGFLKAPTIVGLYPLIQHTR